MMITNLVGNVLTDDLINEILLRLLVKSLLRCQLVSKTWFSLITSLRFVKSQLLCSVECFDTNQTLIVNNSKQNEENKASISLLYVDSRQIVADLKFSYSKGEFPYVPDCILVGSAIEIVCVVVDVSGEPPQTNYYFLPFARRKTNTYLWNPAIRQSKLIPSYSINYDIGREASGFGFDPTDDDFKVVRVVAERHMTWPIRNSSILLNLD